MDPCLLVHGARGSKCPRSRPACTAMARRDSVEPYVVHGSTTLGGRAMSAFRPHHPRLSIGTLIVAGALGAIGLGSSSIAWSIDDPTPPADPQRLDVNGDGNLDVAYTDGNAIVVHLGNGRGGMRAPHTFATAALPGRIGTADF